MLTWPKNPKIDDVIKAVNVLDIRVLALEEIVIQLRQDLRTWLAAYGGETNLKEDSSVNAGGVTKEVTGN